MSVFATTPMGSEWSYGNLSHSTVNTAGGRQHGIGLGLDYGRIQTSSNGDNKPPFRSHHSFPQAMGSLDFSMPDYQASRSHAVQQSAADGVQSSSVQQGSSRISIERIAEATYSGSAPVSPIHQLTPTSVEAEQSDLLDEDDDGPLTAEELDEDIVDGGTPRTAAERRAEKRKMKRFRLTHNQTRFLMSEFARQAHPDAAQRERLSREIPGLSPRQVQVWFQNRRAKLKRLTSDDRERMMKSRALPDDFDMTQALNSPFGTQNCHSQSYSSPIPSPASYASTFGEGRLIRPLMTDGLRRSSDDSTISPMSMISTYSNVYTPPGSGPASEMLSPTSPASERANFMSSMPQNTSPRSANPFIRSSSFSANYHSHSHIPRLHLHERVSRTRAESLNSPLRSSMSYTGNTLDYGVSPTAEFTASSQPARIEPVRSYSTDNANLPHTLGLQNGPPPGFQSSALSRQRPTITTFPPGLDLRPQYRPLLPFSNSSQLEPVQGNGLPINGSQDYPLPQSNLPIDTTTMQTSYVVAFAEPTSHYRREVPAQGRIFEESDVDDYAQIGPTNRQPQQASRGVIEEFDVSMANLQPGFIGGRPRSFTNPMEYNHDQ